MADPAHLLTELRPLHAVASGVDSAAPIVAMALIGCAAAIVLFYTLGPWLGRRRALRRYALEKLAATHALPGPERLAAQAAILRHVAKTLDGAVRRQRGDAWLACLEFDVFDALFQHGARRNLRRSALPAARWPRP